MVKRSIFAHEKEKFDRGGVHLKCPIGSANTVVEQYSKILEACPREILDPPLAMHCFN